MFSGFNNTPAHHAPTNIAHSTSSNADASTTHPATSAAWTTAAPVPPNFDVSQSMIAPIMPITVPLPAVPPHPYDFTQARAAYLPYPGYYNPYIPPFYPFPPPALPFLINPMHYFPLPEYDPTNPADLIPDAAPYQFTPAAPDTLPETIPLTSASVSPAVVTAATTSVSSNITSITSSRIHTSHSAEPLLSSRVAETKSSLSPATQYEQKNAVQYLWGIVPSDGFARLDAKTAPSNAWPTTLSHSSIFPWLYPYSLESTQFPAFAAFVRNWHASMCSMLYRLPTGEYRFLGTATVTSETTVVTARHIYEGVPSDALFVRFTHYQVEPVENNPAVIKVIESHFVTPITLRMPAANGLDAAYLQFKALNDEVSFFYARLLPKNTRTNLLTNGALNQYNYAMFHYTDLKPQISIVRSANNKLDITPVPGASGATIISQTPNAPLILTTMQTMGQFLMVCYSLNSGPIQHKIIPFVDLLPKPNKKFDPYIAPYCNTSLAAVNPRNKILFHVDGYNYLFSHLTKQPNFHQHPSADEKSFCLHPIIPPNDLSQMWDYFYTFTSASEHEDRIPPPVPGNAQTEPCNNPTQSEHESKAVAQFTVAEKPSVQYGIIRNLFKRLCPPALGNKAGFAGSLWNLFQGWKLTYRQDDPTFNYQLLPDDNGSTAIYLDSSEKIKPASFDMHLWICLKGDPATQTAGLYGSIQALKRATHASQKQEAITQFETHLTMLDRIWNSRRDTEKRIHPYVPSDWEERGICADGQKLYRIKRT